LPTAGQGSSGTADATAVSMAVAKATATAIANAVATASNSKACHVTASLLTIISLINLLHDCTQRWPQSHHLQHLGHLNALFCCCCFGGSYST